MEREIILYPIFVMVLLTTYVSILLAKLRIRAIVKDGLTPGYFYYNKGSRPPEYLLRTEQHYTNLFEMPVLFYTGILLAYSASYVDMISVGLGWLFVISRVLHAYIHMRLNRLMARRRIFIVGVTVLLTLWLYLFLQLALR